MLSGEEVWMCGPGEGREGRGRSEERCLFLKYGYSGVSAQAHLGI